MGGRSLRAAAARRCPPQSFLLSLSSTPCCLSSLIVRISPSAPWLGLDASPTFAVSRPVSCAACPPESDRKLDGPRVSCRGGRGQGCGDATIGRGSPLSLIPALPAGGWSWCQRY